MDFNIPIGLDTSGIRAGFDEIRQQLLDAQRIATQNSAALSAAYGRGAQAANTMSQAIRNTNTNFQGATTSARNLENAIDQIGDQTRNLNNGTEQVNRYRQAWNTAVNFFRTGGGVVRSFFQGVREGVNDAIADLRRYEAEAREASRTPHPTGGGSGGGEEDSGGGSGGGLGEAALGIGDLVTGGLITGGITSIISGVVELGKKVIDTRAEFQKFEEVLTIALGDRSQAQAAMKQLNDFAARTPFGVQELTEDYVKLVNRGFIPTEKELTKMGDLAASQGKSFDQLTEAVLDAQSGEFERLKEFGIRASSSGNQVTLAFGNTTTTVKKSEKAIRDAVLAFGELPQVAGGMEAVSKTLGGQISNIEDNVGQLFNTLGEGIEGYVSEAIGKASDVIAALNTGLKDGSIAAFFQPITEGFSTLVTSLQSAGTKIYEFAKTSGVFDTITHAIDSLVEVLGGLIGGLGDVITYLVNLYTEGGTFKTIIDNTILLPLRIGWGLTISFVEGLRAIPFAFAALKAGVEQFVTNIKANFHALIDELNIIKLKVQEAFTFDDAKAAGLKAQIEQLEKDKQQYLSKVKSVADAAQDAYRKAEEEAEAKRKARKAQKPADTGTGVTITGRGGTAQEAGPTEAEIKAAIALQKKKNDQLLKLAQELRDAEIAAMEDGDAKQKAIIEDNYKSKVENIYKEKALTTEAANAQAQLQIELFKAKEAALEKLRLNKIKREAELQAEVNKLQLEGQAESKDKAVKLIDLEFDARAQQIKERFKNEAALRDQALAAVEVARGNAKKGATLNYDLQDIQNTEENQLANLAIIQKYGKKTVEQEKAIQLEILKVKIKAAEDTIAALLDSGKDESDAQVQQARRVLAALNAEFGNAKKTAPKYDIFDLFGLKFTDTEKEQLTGAFSSLMSSLNSIWTDSINMQIEAKQRQIDMLDKQIEAIEDNVDKQKELAEQGLANDLTVAQAELDAKKEQKAKEQKELEELQKKQNKAQQAQIAANGLMQVSNLVLSATQIFAAHSGIPFVGVALAIAAVGAMYATFASMKAKAAELGKTTTSTYRTGGKITQGKDHAQGGIKYYSPDGTDIKELQVGEYIINRDSTQKYHDLIEAINNDDLGAFAIHHQDDWLREQLSGTGAHLDREETARVLAMAKGVRNKQIEASGPALSGKWNDEKLDSMDKNIAELVQMQKKAPKYRETPEYFIFETPNRITKVRK